MISEAWRVGFPRKFFGICGSDLPGLRLPLRELFIGERRPLAHTFGPL